VALVALAALRGGRFAVRGLLAETTGADSVAGADVAGAGESEGVLLATMSVPVDEKNIKPSHATSSALSRPYPDYRYSVGETSIRKMSIALHESNLFYVTSSNVQNL
jgi:hypothetical protein